MTRYVIGPDLVYGILLLLSFYFARFAPQPAAFAMTLFAFLWLKEQLSVAGLRTSQKHQFAAAESLLLAALFFRRMEACLPIKYTCMLLICDLDAISYSMQEQQRYDEALKYNKEALEIAEARFGKDSAEVLSQTINRSFILATRGDSQEAERIAEEAVNKLEARMHTLSKTQAENLCLALNNLGTSYIDQRKIEKALDAFDRSVNLKAKVLGASSDSIAVGYGNQGYSMLKAGKYAASEEYTRRALKLVEGKPIELNVVATYRNNLGEALRGQQKFADATVELEKAFEIRKGCLTAEHPHMGYSYHNLAQLYADKGDNTRAREFFEKAIAIRKAHPGPKNTELIETNEAYSAFLSKIGESSAASKVHAGSETPAKGAKKPWAGAKAASFALIVIVMTLPIYIYAAGTLTSIIRHNSK